MARTSGKHLHMTMKSTPRYYLQSPGPLLFQTGALRTPYSGYNIPLVCTEFFYTTTMYRHSTSSYTTLYVQSGYGI